MSRPLHRGTALCALLAASVAAGADGGVQSTAAAPFALGLPDRPWQLLVELPGFEMEPVQRLAGGARTLGRNARSALFISLTLATSPGDPSARSCRDHDWAGRQKFPVVREDTRLSAQGDKARVEFLVPGDSKEAVQEKNVLLYLERDGVCAIVHLSQPGYRGAQDALELERVLASVRFAP